MENILLFKKMYYLSGLIIMTLIIFWFPPTIYADSSQNIYYKKSNDSIFSPFRLEIDKMERLILIDFKDDPDEIYYCFEIQVFNDNINGEGIRIIAYRNDKYIDVYQQPTLAKNNNYADIGNGLADLKERPLKKAKFITNPTSINVYFNFNDKLGRNIEVEIKENTDKKRNSFNVLAPVGDSAAQPSSLPLFLLYDFYFIRKKDTEFKISIEDKIHQADSFPIPLDWSRCYFTRYSLDPFLAKWNSNQQGPVTRLTNVKTGEINYNGLSYQIIDNQDHYEIKSIKAEGENHQIKVDFFPAIADIESLKNGVNINGNFAISSDSSIGSISGNYLLQKNNNLINFKITSNEGWVPDENRLILKLMYQVVPVFKNWPKSYLWSAKIDLNNEKQAVINSKWTRKEK